MMKMNRIFLFFLTCLMLVAQNAQSKIIEEQALLEIAPKPIFYYVCVDYLKDSDNFIKSSENHSFFSEFTNKNTKRLLTEYCSAYIKEDFENAQKFSQKLRIVEPQSSIVQLMQYDNMLKTTKKAFERVEQFEKSLVRFQNLNLSFGEAFKAQYRLEHKDTYTAYKILSKMKQHISCFSEYAKLLELWQTKNTSYEQELDEYKECQSRYHISYDQQTLEKVHQLLSYNSGLEYTKLETIDYDRYQYKGQDRYRPIQPKKKLTKKEQLLRDLSGLSE